MKTPKVFDLGYASLGNGITVYDRKQTEFGDWINVAHIDINNPLKPIIKYYSKATDKMKIEITQYAKPKFVAFENLKAISTMFSQTQGYLYIYQDDVLLTTYSLVTLPTHKEIDNRLYSVYLKLLCSELLLPTLSEQIKNKWSIKTKEQIFNLPHPEFKHLTK